MTEFYAPMVREVGRTLFRDIRAWAEPTGRVTLLGGWAVHELVEPLIAQESRDVDLILHDEATVRDFDARLPSWNLQWSDSPKGTPMECHRRPDAAKTIIVDVFTPEPFPRFFRGHAADNLKDPPDGVGFVPPLEFLLRDKVMTVPLRQGRDAYAKKAKDLLDIRNIAFHNRAGVTPRRLLETVPFGLRKEAAASVPIAVTHRPEFEAEIREAQDWLLRR